GGADQFGKGLTDLRLVHDDHGQARSHDRGGFGRMGTLVGPGALETDGERRNRLASVAAAEAEYDRGVEPAADVGHDRYVAAQPELDGLLQEGLQLIDQGRGVREPALLTGVRKVEIPVVVLGDPPVLDLQEMPRRQRMDTLEEGPSRPRAEECEQMIDAANVRLRPNHCRGQQGFDLRTPEQPAVN